MKRGGFQPHRDGQPFCNVGSGLWWGYTVREDKSEETSVSMEVEIRHGFVSVS